MKKSKLAILTSILLAGCGPSAEQIAQEKQKAACLMAEAILTEGPRYYDKENRVYEDTKMNPNYDIEDADLPKLLAEWPLGPYPRIAQDHFRAFAAQPASNAFFACPDLKRLAVSKGYKVGSEAAIEAAHDPKTGNLRDVFTSQIISFTLPYLSEDGNSALVAYRMSVGGLDGHGMLVLYRKNAEGNWELVDVLRLWIS